jgi:hypothetical protein
MMIHRNRPRTSYTDENCVIVEGLIREDRSVKLRGIAEVTGIAKNTLHELISGLNFCKLSACWVPKMLTEEHKSKRMAALLENHLEVKKKFHDLETFSFTHYKKGSKLSHLWKKKKQW